MPEARRDEADDGEAEREYLDAAHGVRVVQRYIEDARDVTREQRGGYRDVEEYRERRARVADGDGADEEIQRERDEEVGDFIGMMTHRVTSFDVDYRYWQRNFSLMLIM